MIPKCFVHRDKRHYSNRQKLNVDCKGTTPRSHGHGHRRQSLSVFKNIYKSVNIHTMSL